MTLVEGSTGPLWALATLPLWVVIAKLEGLYDADHPKIWHLTADEVPAVFHWVTLSVAGTLFLIRALPDVTLTVYSATTLYVVALASAFCLRAAARALWRRLVPPERALVLGSGKLADAVARKLALEPGHHLSVSEVTGPKGLNGSLLHDDGVDQLSRADLEYLFTESRAQRVVLAVPELDEATLARVVSVCRVTGVKLSVMPPMRAMLGTAVRLSHIAEMPVIEYGTWGTSWSTMAMKRVLDIGLSAVGLIVLSPLLLVVALAVRVDSRGPALFSQKRAGRRGRPFRIMKFRTMCEDAEQRISEVISVDELDRADVQAARRSARHARRALPATHEPRRAPAAVQRPQGRHEPRRPSPRGGLAGGALRGDGALPPRHAARDHRPHAGPRTRASSTSRSASPSSASTSRTTACART